MNLEENYLDNLLKSVTNPEETQDPDINETNNEETVIENPVITEEPSVSEEILDEPDIEEISIEELSVEEPIIEEPIIEEPIIEESSVEEPIIEEASIEEPDIEGLDEAINAETELEMAAEFTVDSALESEMKDVAGVTSNEEAQPLDELPLDSEPEESPSLDDEMPLDIESEALDEIPLDIESEAEDTSALDEIPLDIEPEEESASALDEMPLDAEPLDIETETTPLDDTSLDDTSLDVADSLDSVPLDAEGEKSEISSNDSLEDILSMLDDDSELAEINDMLKKSDNNEPIQDDMMDLLNQMADDEAKSVNEGVMELDEDDEGVPLPEYTSSVTAGDLSNKSSDITSDAEVDSADISSTSFSSEPPKEKETAKPPKNESLNDSTDAEEDDEQEAPKKKKPKKEKVKKEKPKKEKKSKEDDDSKKDGKFNKFINMLTEDLVPEPTEAELAAEKEAKEAKKQENLTKKEEEKKVKDEEKKAKAEEKEAAKKAKAEEDAKKKKEKAEAAKAKKEAKAAKKAAEAEKNKGKKIPKKNIIAAALFGITVFGAVMIATTILSQQGYLSTARKAFYNQDYKSVYQATYGMNLDDEKSDGLIKARSEVIMKMQRRYDSYQTNIKMGREVEALDALLQGLRTYDYINADAEQYGVMSEIDEIKNNILNILQAKYGLDEEDARTLMNEEDATVYTIALNNIINNN